MSDVVKRTVYSVSSGEYSDYGVLGLFEDRGDAEANAARNPRWYVEEFALHPPGAGDVMQQVIEYSATAWVSMEGKILDYVNVCRHYTWPEDADPPEEVLSSVHESTFSMISVDNGARRFQPEWPIGAKVYEVYAHVTRDEVRARKAVQERAARVAAAIAQGEPVETSRASVSGWGCGGGGSLSTAV